MLPSVDNLMSALKRSAPIIRRWTIAEVTSTEAGQALVRKQLEAILEGKAFEGSERSRRFLEFVVQNAAGRRDVKERTLGMELFGRDPAYDTALDPIVRSAATSVRRRLASHYRDAGQDEPFVIYLPQGTYVPELRTRDDVFLSIPTDLPWMSIPHGSPYEEDSDARPILKSSPAWGRWISVLTFLALSLAALSIWHWRMRSIENTRTSFLNRSNDLILVTGDPELEGRSKPDVPMDLSEYVNQSRSQKNQSHNDKGVRNLGGNNGFRPQVYATDAELMVESSLLFRSRRRLRATTARDLQASLFTTNNDFVVLGSSISNPWVSMFEPVLDFRYSLDQGTHALTVVNVRSLQGEQALYEPRIGSADEVETFAIVTLLKQTNSDSRVLLLGGLAPEANLAASHFFGNATQWSAAIHSCKQMKEPGPEFTQMLLHLRIVSGVPDSVEAVACHIHTIH